MDNDTLSFVYNTLHVYQYFIEMLMINNSNKYEKSNFN